MTVGMCRILSTFLREGGKEGGREGGREGDECSNEKQTAVTEI